MIACTKWTVLLTLAFATSALADKGFSVSTNQRDYQPGDTMSVSVRLWNHDSGQPDVLLYLLLEWQGAYFFYPGFGTDPQPLTRMPLPSGLDSGELKLLDIPLAVSGQRIDAQWLSALVDAREFLLLADVGIAPFTIHAVQPPIPTATNAPATNTPAPTATPTQQPPTATPTVVVTLNPYPFFPNVTVAIANNRVTVSSDGIPTHNYGPFPGVGNPNSVLPQNNVFTFALIPTPAATPGTLNMGPIGVMINGVPFYNPYNAQGQDAVSGPNAEIFDNCQGHPQMSGQYHYHQIPQCLLAQINDPPGGHSTIVGYALDGYALYGPYEGGGQTPTGLDSCNGHFGPTPEYPGGIYHYHMTTTFPYLLGCYHGVKIR